MHKNKFYNIASKCTLCASVVCICISLVQPNALPEDGPSPNTALTTVAITGPTGPSGHSSIASKVLIAYHPDMDPISTPQLNNKGDSYYHLNYNKGI